MALGDLRGFLRPPIHHRPVLPADPPPDYLFAYAAYVYFPHRMAVDINYTSPEVYIAARKAAEKPLLSETSEGVIFAFEDGRAHLEFR